MDRACAVLKPLAVPWSRSLTRCDLDWPSGPLQLMDRACAVLTRVASCPALEVRLSRVSVSLRIIRLRLPNELTTELLGGHELISS